MVTAHFELEYADLFTDTSESVSNAGGVGGNSKESYNQYHLHQWILLFKMVSDPCHDGCLTTAGYSVNH